MNGVRDVPSLYKTKALQKSLQDACGVEIRQFSGAFGHTYYVVRPQSLAAMVR